MTTYLDLIPRDLAYLIFYKVNDVGELFYNGVYKEILDDVNFWERNIRYSTQGLNLELIPRYLYDYKGLPVEITIEHFNILRRAFRSAEISSMALSKGSTEVILKSSTINNLKAYVHVDKIISSGELSNIRYYETRIMRIGNGFDVTFSGNHGNQVELLITLNYEQTVSLVTHSICNYGLSSEFAIV